MNEKRKSSALRTIPALIIACLLCAAQPAFAGSIVNWGSTIFDSAQLGGNDFVAIAAGHYYNLALRADGSIARWGSGSGVVYGLASPPDGNDFTAIAAGEYHSLALKSDGSIVAWGSNGSGQANAPDGNDFVAIAAGDSFSAAIREPCQYNLAGDLNNDCRVNFTDFCLMMENWLADCRGQPTRAACVPK